jgi:hypothetical protein
VVVVRREEGREVSSPRHLLPFFFFFFFSYAYAMSE